MNAENWKLEYFSPSVSYKYEEGMAVKFEKGMPVPCKAFEGIEGIVGGNVVDGKIPIYVSDGNKNKIFKINQTNILDGFPF